MKKKFRVGTRGSRLAVTQTKQALKILQDRFPEIELEIIEIVTKGDRLATHSLTAIGGQGAFVKEIEKRLTDREIDLAVHSLKDVPTTLPENLTLGCVLKRENPLDCLIFTKEKLSLEQLPEHAKVGTSSLRRKAQLLKKRPDLTILPIRGNIDTRIRKLHEENFDGIVLAAAGIKRLDIADSLNYQELSMNDCVPAVGQGALAMECRQGDQDLLKMLRTIEDQSTLSAITAERSFLKHMDGSCTFPIGAFATIEGEQIRLTGMVANIDGSILLKKTLVDQDPISLGKKVAHELINSGAEQLIKECKADVEKAFVHQTGENAGKNSAAASKS